LVAEARSLQDGLNSVIQARLDHLIIEADNKIVIQAWKERFASLGRFITLLRISMHGIHMITNHVFREANIVAD